MVFDGVGGDIGREAFEITGDGSRFLAYGAPSGGFAAIDPEEPNRRRVTLFGIHDVQFASPDKRRLTAQALADGATGRFRPLIGQTFPLKAASDAHEAVEAREVVGKTLLVP